MIALLVAASLATATIPFDGSRGFIQGYRVRVNRDDLIGWNSQPVSDTTFTEWLGMYARLRPGAPRLNVEFEPGIPKKRADWVRREIIKSGLCDARRCAEVGWNVKRPVVNAPPSSK